MIRLSVSEWRGMFENREEAGRQLAERLAGNELVGGVRKKELLVLSIPRGGVAVGKEVVLKLGCEHDVVVTKKIGAPGNEELAVGAVAEDGEEVIGITQYSKSELESQVGSAREKVRSYVEKFRKGKGLSFEGKKLVIVVDDGIATGETARAAIKWLRGNIEHPRQKGGQAIFNFQIILAVPVCAQDTVGEIERLVDSFVCLEVESDFRAVGEFYENFPQVSDDGVIKLLDESRTHKDKSDAAA